MRRHQLRTTLNVKLTQRLAMTPSLLQKIELLTLNRMELSQLLEHELTENPVLEEQLERPDVEEIREEAREASSALEGEERAIEEFDYEYFFGEYMTPSQKRFEFESPEDRASFETFLATSLSLSDHLNWQLNMAEVDSAISEIAYFIIGNINVDGYLTISPEEMAIALDAPVEKVMEALRLVQSFDPPGVGSANLQECLLYQIRAAGLAGSLAEVIVRDHLSELEAKRYKEVAKLLKTTLEEIAEALEVIRSFDPRPGQKFNSDQPIYIEPDVYIQRGENGFEVKIADDGLPKLRLNRAYRRLLGKAGVSKDAKSFIKEKMRSAIELLKSVDQRHQTIYRVCEAIVLRQEEFLERGNLYLKPMLIKEIAEELGVHSSTISRVVSNKYAHTPQGIIELRKFFTVGVEGADGENISTIQVKDRIRKIIEAENQDKPLSDQKIARLLNKDGIQITRRTVAKYRDQMNIAGSRERKTAIVL